MGISPPEMMDRSKACIPDLQLEFLDTVVRPTYEILSNIFPETSYFLEIINSNRQHWSELKGAVFAKHE